jgi:RNA polymerase sigma-70 factor (ECF subfamily)
LVSLLFGIFTRTRAAAISPEADNEREEVARLYREHAGAVYSFMLARVRNSADAEDLTATVFRKALENWHTFRKGESGVAWLFGIARYTLADHFRAHIRYSKRASALKPDEFDALEDKSAGPEEKALQADEARLVRDAIQKLPPQQQEVITLKFTAQLEYREIAAILGKKEPAIRMLVHRGLENLRRELGT